MNDKTPDFTEIVETGDQTVNLAKYFTVTVHGPTIYTSLEASKFVYKIVNIYMFPF